MSSKPKPANKILRIGLIQNGKIVEERLMRSVKAVTIGHGLKKNVLVVPASNLPKSYKLFEPNEGGYLLYFTSQMSGRISLGDGVYTLEELVSSKKAKKSGGNYVLRLNARSRGKVKFGEVTVLFQFVSPPPPRPKPVLPTSMRGGWIRGIDPYLAGILVLSAILQIGFVAFVELNDWPEPLDSADMAVSDRFVQIMGDKDDEPDEPEPEPEKADGEGEGESKAEKEEPDTEPKEEQKTEPKEEEKPKTAEERAQAEAERRARMAEKVERSTILHQLGAVTEDGTMVDTLADGAGKTSMERAFAGSNRMASGELGAEKGLDTSGSADADGTGSAAGIGDMDAASGAKDAEKGVDTGKVEETKVKARVDIGDDTQTVGGELDSGRISSVVRRGASAIQRCFERELRNNPEAGGRLVITVTIGGAGRVTDVKTQSGIGGGFSTCVKRAVKRWRFPRPKGGDVIFKKTFVLQGSS